VNPPFFTKLRLVTVVYSAGICTSRVLAADFNTRLEEVAY